MHEPTFILKACIITNKPTGSYFSYIALAMTDILVNNGIVHNIGSVCIY